MGIEFLLLFFVLGVIVTAASAAVFFAFILPGLLESVGYPVVVPGWKMRLNSSPPFNTSLEELSKGLNELTDRCVELKSYDRKKVVKRINSLKVQWVPSEGEGKRHIVDQWGRTIAGDKKGKFVRVVYLPEDRLGDVALFHEIGHDLHEIEGLVDYDHKDDLMWVNIVNHIKNKFK